METSNELQFAMDFETMKGQVAFTSKQVLDYDDDWLAFNQIWINLWSRFIADESKVIYVHEWHRPTRQHLTKPERDI